jgi:hypothetical protein
MSKALDEEKLKKQRNIEQAACGTHHRDSSVASLFHWLGYRSRVAQDILEAPDEKTRKLLMELYDTCNENIKNLLNI